MLRWATSFRFGWPGVDNRKCVSTVGQGVTRLQSGAATEKDRYRDDEPHEGQEAEQRKRASSMLRRDRAERQPDPPGTESRRRRMARRTGPATHHQCVMHISRRRLRQVNRPLPLSGDFGREVAISVPWRDRPGCPQLKRTRAKCRLPRWRRRSPSTATSAVRSTTFSPSTDTAPCSIRRAA